MKQIYWIALVFLLSFGYTESKPMKKADFDSIRVIYFHGTTRCKECIAIETFAQGTLQKNFKEGLKSGKIRWNSIDFLDEKNEHYQEDYKLETQALILAKYEKGKQVSWLDLPKIWNFTGDASKFEKYVTGELKKFIRKK